MKLSPLDREKIDISDDRIFYKEARYVYHLGPSFRKRLTRLYSYYLNKENILLDLMSSWVSHLPPNVIYKKIIGHGLNEYELKANNRLDKYWVQNFNTDQSIPIADSSIDACLIVAGWQYLQYPENISIELSRVLKKNSFLIVSFTNRAFWNKAPNIWTNSSEYERIQYVRDILLDNGWRVEKIYNERTFEEKIFGIYKSEGDPFYSIVARNDKSNN